MNNVFIGVLMSIFVFVGLFVYSMSCLYVVELLKFKLRLPRKPERYYPH